MNWVFSFLFSDLFPIFFFLEVVRCRTREVLPVLSDSIETFCDGDESIRTRMSTKRFAAEVRTRVDVGSLKGSGIQRMDSRMEMLGAIVVVVVVVLVVRTRKNDSLLMLKGRLSKFAGREVESQEGRGKAEFGRRGRKSIPRPK